MGQMRLSDYVQKSNQQETAYVCSSRSTLKLEAARSLFHTGKSSNKAAPVTPPNCCYLLN